jgi:sigma-B regulation protein RsbU (phosphoserine phosphatase)
VPTSLPRDVVTADSDTDPVRVLLVEDNPGDARLLEEIVADAGGGDITIRHVPALGEALTLLDLELFDVALLDLSLPDAHGLEVLEQVHGRAPALPIVVLSGLEDEELAVSAVHEGAQDYLVKRHLQGELLVRSLRYAIERAHVLARLEQAKAEQLRIKDELLSLVSHELRTPLAASYQFVTILLDGLAGPLAEQQRHYLEITLRNLLDLRAMVDDLLESNRGQAGIEVRPHPASVSELVDDAITTFSAAVDDKQLELRGAVEPGLPMVLADPGRVGQILGNLIGNAVKHTPAGGTITLGARPVAGELVAISVTDTGEGIPPADLDRVFDRLYQVPGRHASRRGLGLGLYICRELVLAHGGQIWAESTLGEGSTFTFTLPAVAAPAGHVSPPPVQLPAEVRG